MIMQIKGVAALRQELLTMAKEASALELMPIVAGAAWQLRNAEFQLAPKRTGKGAGSITVQLIKAGSGYAYALVGPAAEFYYMQFQEYGLGTGRSTPVSERVRRRRGNYDVSMGVRRGLLDRGVTPVDFMGAYWDWRNTRGSGRSHKRVTGAPFGLSAGELRRQKILAQAAIKGRRWDLQGGHRPNMAAHPFARPAVNWRSPWIRQYITDALLRLIQRHEKAA